MCQKWGKGIKVENFNGETRFGHGALRSKHEPTTGFAMGFKVETQTRALC